MKRILAACVLLLMGSWASAQVNGQGGVYINGVLQGGGGGAGANTALSNLASVAINATLHGAISSSTFDLGISGLALDNEETGGPGTIYLQPSTFRSSNVWRLYGTDTPFVIAPQEGILFAGSSPVQFWDWNGAGIVPIVASGMIGFDPITDIAPTATLIKPANAWPGATTNTSGANVIFAGGIGKRRLSVIDYSNGTMALSTVTITVNGTATTKTEGTEWQSITSNAATAISLAAAIDAISGVRAEASGANINIFPDDTAYSLTIAKTAADAGMTATSGTDGIVSSKDSITIASAGGNIILDTNGGAGFRLRNAANDGYASSVSMGGVYVWTDGIHMQSCPVYFQNDAYGPLFGDSLDTGIIWSSANVLKVTNGSTGTGSIIASTAITAVGTAAANGYIRTGVYKRAWTNAEVTAFGAVLSGDLKVATLPAKTIVRNAYLVIDSQASGTTTLTVSLGRTSTAYIDYIVASNAMVGANTVYGDATTVERGTNLTGWDLPSYTAAIDVYVQFVATDASKKLADVLGCTGQVYLLTETLP